MPLSLLPCDGCGQLATPEHLNRRLRRLEWTTRFRPVHVQTLFLAAVAPESDGDFLYSLPQQFSGEGAELLGALAISRAGRGPAAVVAQFQRQGFLLTHALECPLERNSAGQRSLSELLTQRIGPLVSRLRRSLKAKRVVPISPELVGLLPALQSSAIADLLVLDDGKPFILTGGEESSVQRLRAAL